MERDCATFLTTFLLYASEADNGKYLKINSFYYTLEGFLELYEGLNHFTLSPTHVVKMFNFCKNSFCLGKLHRKIFGLVAICALGICYFATFLVNKSGVNVDIYESLQRSQRKTYCGENFKLQNATVIRKDWDFKLFKRPKFLKNFKNPCFFQNVTIRVDKTKTTSTQLRLRCLPYFLIAGFPKAGTSDLWVRLLNHPDVKLRHIKEPRFFNIGRFKEGSFDRAAAKYVSIFDRSAYELHRLVSPVDCSDKPFPFYHGITGEGTVDVVFDNKFWEMLPGNEHCREPVITNADYVHHINPDIKVIFIVRNPVERLYSDYIYEARFIKYPVSRHLFHEAVVDAIKNHTDCRKHNSLRACAYNATLETFKIRLRVGMYNIFISDWLEIFPRKNILVVRSEDTGGQNREATYKRILEFLNIRPFTRLEEVSIFQRGPTNTRSASEKKLGDMLPETRTLIENFYEPFNKKLTKMYPEIDYNIPDVHV